MYDIIKSIVTSFFTLLTVIISIYTYLEQLRITNTSNVAREALNQLESIRSKIWQIQHHLSSDGQDTSLQVNDIAIVELQALFGNFQNSLYLLQGSPLVDKDTTHELCALINDCMQIISHQYNVPLTLENNYKLRDLLVLWGSDNQSHVLKCKKTLSRIYQMADKVKLGLGRWLN